MRRVMGGKGERKEEEDGKVDRREGRERREGEKREMGREMRRDMGRKWIGKEMEI